MNERKNYGRRKADRRRLGIGILVGLTVAGVVLSKVGCDGTATAPTPVARPSASPAAVGGTVAPPTAVLPDDPTQAYELICSTGARMQVKYNGEASRARVETWWTTFDSTTPNDIKTDEVNKGDSVYRTFKVCVQGDARGVPGKEIGGCFYDKNGNPFRATPENKKLVDECRTTPCDPESERSWIEDPEYRDGEESSCSPNNQPPTEQDGVEALTVTQKCFRKKTRTWTSTNTCTKQTRTRTIWVYNECECPCELVKFPNWGAFTIVADDDGNNQSVKASVQVNNAGIWKLDLYAANQQSEYPNHPDYGPPQKPSVSKTLKCGESFTLVNEYDWKNHESDEWWFKLYLDGALKATSIRIHKD